MVFVFSGRAEAEWARAVFVCGQILHFVACEQAYVVHGLLVSLRVCMYNVIYDGSLFKRCVIKIILSLCMCVYMYVWSNLGFRGV